MIEHTLLSAGISKIAGVDEAGRGPCAGPLDAKKVAALGISALVVSNHGGRQLDRSPVPLEILGEIVKAVGNKVEVYLDGGVLSGQDVYAAIALGAKAVMIGRSYLYGIMAGGELGVNLS